MVEDCVNAVGVDVNTASAPLLARISGLNATLAAVPIAVVGLDPDGFVALSNPAADALLGTGTPLLGGTLELPQRADAGMVRNGRHYRVVRQEVQLPGQRCGTVLSFLEEGR